MITSSLLNVEMVDGVSVHTIYNHSMRRKPVIAIVGAGRENEPAITHAREMGRLIADNGWVLVSGGRDAGVMRAANEGARDAGGLTIGILPDSASEISTSVDVAIITDVGQGRNNIIVLSADIVVACGVDGAGTASEVSLAAKGGKPVILVAPNEVAKAFFSAIGGDKIHIVEDAGGAIEIAKGLLY